MGHASYDTMAYAKIGDVLGHGRHNYAGIGLYADYGTSVEGLKLTGYLKGGAFSNHLNTQLVGQKVKFDNTGAYWGVHLGTHYDFQFVAVRLFPTFMMDCSRLLMMWRVAKRSLARALSSIRSPLTVCRLGASLSMTTRPRCAHTLVSRLNRF